MILIPKNAKNKDVLLAVKKARALRLAYALKLLPASSIGLSLIQWYETGVWSHPLLESHPGAFSEVQSNE